ncbi:MAG: nucleotide-binding universal stress UspA family protein [Planctomycetota bacterium]|jgi:nucleotide-binding universal stress UspA family protein
MPSVPNAPSGIEAGAVDLSPAGQAVIDHAIAWAKAHVAELLILHVVHDPELAPAFTGNVPGDVQRAEAALRDLAEKAPVKCLVQVLTAENIAAAIVAAAKDSSYIVVGSQGKSAFQRLRLGSIATAVLRHSHVPVVCCPHPDKAS